MNLSEYLIKSQNVDMVLNNDVLIFDLLACRYYLENTDKLYYFNPCIINFAKNLKTICSDTIKINLTTDIHRMNLIKLKVEIIGSEEDLLSIYLHAHGCDFLENCMDNDVYYDMDTVVKENSLILTI